MAPSFSSTNLKLENNLPLRKSAVISNKKSYTTDKQAPWTKSSGVVLPTTYDGYKTQGMSSSSTADYGQATQGEQRPAFDTEAKISELFNQMASGNAEAERELMELAKGDYDLVAKWLEKAYTNATGTDDVKRKEFINKVANKLEEEIGTIAFDYETGTFRTAEDLGIAKEGLEYTKDTVLKRLAEDDATYKQQYQKQAEADRSVTAEDINRRGLLNASYDAKTGQSGIQGVGANNVNQLEDSVQTKFDALARATGRTEEDTMRDYTTGMASAELGANRTQEDLTTTARRGMTGAGDTYNSGLEQAEQARKAREIQIKQQKKQADDQAMLLAKQQAEREANQYYAS